MKSIDHFILGKNLSEKMLDNAGSAQRFLFVIGNVLPDKLPHTYLCRLAECEKYRGHNFNNTKNKVERYMNCLMSKNSLTGFDYLWLGILCHYVADAFTFPHNSNFPGTLKEHVQYEGILHDYVGDGHLENVIDYAVPQLPFLNSSMFLFDLYNLYHLEYEKQEMGYENDIHYIGMVTRVLVGNIVVNKDVCLKRHGLKVENIILKIMGPQ